MKSRSLGSLVVCVALLLIGCRGKVAWPPQPASLHFGEASCATCRMIISDSRFAVQLHFRDGGVEVFDDLGCLAKKHAGELLPPESIFIQSYQDGRWIRGDEARIVQSGEIRSPMGYGFAAFPGSAAAAQATEPLKDAKVFSIEQLLRLQPKHPIESGRE